MDAAEKLLEKTISKYNETVSNINKFQFNERETLLFVNMLKQYHQEMMQKEVVQFNLHDRVQMGEFVGRIESEPKLVADILWLHNEAYEHNVDLKNLKHN